MCILWNVERYSIAMCRSGLPCMTALCRPMIHVKLLYGDLYNSRIALNVKE